MKICLISEYFYPDNAGGTPTVLSNLARHLKDHYGDVKIDAITSTNLYRGEAQQLSRFENWDGIRIFRLKTPKSNRPSTALRLLAGLMFTAATFSKLLRGPKYDLIFIVTNPPTLPIAAKLFCKMRRTPYVYLIHDLYPDVATALHVLPRESKIATTFHRLQHGWLHSANSVVVIGRCMRDYLVKEYQLPAERIEVITNWSDADEIRPLGKDTEFRRANGLSGFIVLYAGNFGQYQNFDCILDAAKRLQKEDTPINFVFVGAGARREYIADRIKNENLANVRMLPFVPKEHFGDMLASADVSLVTLEPGAEGVGVPSKFYNILASGRPTVALVSPSSEVARVLEEADCGIVVEQGDDVALTEAIASLAHSPANQERLGRNARSVFEAKYTLPQVAKRFHELFSQVIAKR
jgi:colanic acid biosynthesis glycosyl transferase WcaI